MDMLSIHIERTSDTPIYEQLYIYIKKEIDSGKITFGEKLPSKRKLAEFLKISQNTVETAYEQLVAEGYVESVPRKGYFVQAYEDLEYVQKEMTNTSREQQPIIQMKYHFHPGWVDTEHFPFEKWRKYAKQTMEKENRHLLLAGNQQGEYELRKEICQYLFQARGVHCSPEQIVIGAGLEILLQQLILLLNKRTVYGVEDPGYHVISHLLKKYEYHVLPLEVDEEGVNVGEIEEKNINVIYVTPSHHFPYGSILSVNRRTKLLNWAAARPNRFIIEDDYDSEFRYSGKSIPSLQSMDQNGKVIYLGTFSKSLMPSIRISYMVLPDSLLQKYKKELTFYQCSVSRIDQHILTEFMRNGDFEKHLNRMRKIYRRKLEKVLDLLKPYQELTVSGAHSGFHLVLEVNNGLKEKELVDRALQAGLKVYPVSAYSIIKREETLPKIVLGFAGIPEKELGTAIKLLLKSWKIF
ncbi:MocR-like pyridoxine biosynthesis transcription factor PdxR [Caldibacillus thermoamylovorans]|uniref:MocR-like pyridoxine biosynthesis transcription factor PdxR n=1 Tax=Caldibacillus thermoamylovorans TaxID=35841 RepID=UPI00203F7951|nr:PLP-dependent aminotransferase family protein [Caldibacillus thermoamylovorans]MCM3478052.1 PLP-dependent aminotransferase family protein [Caldibacillus thermoamylovorans]